MTSLNVAMLLQIALVGGMLSTSVGAAPSAEFSVDQDLLRLVPPGHGSALPISIKSPSFVLDAQTVGGESPSGAPGDLGSGKPVELSYAPIPVGDSGRLDVKLHLQWSAKESVLRKWASYRFTGDLRPLVKEIVLDRMDPSIKGTQVCRVPPQSYPVLLNGFFAGIEYPVASTRIEDGRVIVAHQPGVRMESGRWYETRKAVYGIASPGKEREAFERYIAAHYPREKSLHVNYNSWWTTGIPYSEQEVLDLMGIFRNKLHKPYGVAFDTFCIDMGWSDEHTVWEIDKKLFPDGFRKVEDGAHAMGSVLGMWLSPASGYPEALDNNWAKSQGFKTYPGMALGGPEMYPLICVTDERYLALMREHLVETIRKYGVQEFKLDNARLECPATDHGHEPGQLAAEPLAEAMISVFSAVREAAPDAWTESFAFGPYQSPWWLFHVETLVSQYGADAPYGHIPCPVYRESYTTARDYYNLIGDRLNVCPISDLEVCGIVHQTPDPFMNDAVMTIMRGSTFLPLYLNPRYMDDSRWKALADVLKWTRKNKPIVRQTHPIEPLSTASGSAATMPSEAPVPREPYGYAHCSGNKGLIAIRNPWIAPTTYRLDLGGAIGVSPGARDLSVVSIYPEVRLYGRDLGYGGHVILPLAPYETVVISVRSDQPVDGLPRAAESLRKRISSEVISKDVERVRFQSPTEALGSDWTNPVHGTETALRVKLDAEITVDAPKSELLILLEDRSIPADPICTVRVNGKESPVTVCGSDTGWAADASRSACRTEQWLFLKTPLAQGKNRVEIDLLGRSSSPKVSVWAWASKDGKAGRSDYPNALPEPESIYLDAVNILRPIDAASPLIDETSVPAPVERIDGIFLDAMPELPALDPSLMRVNTSVSGKPMMIAGRSYERGLGSVATVKIAVPLDGKYRRFQSWTGVDSGIELWDESMITFEVWVDGQRKWNSSVMERRTPAEWADVDISGAKSLELVTVNNGTPKTQARAFNNIDWAGARLLR